MLEELSAEFLLISYSLNRCSKHIGEQKLESFYEK